METFKTFLFGISGISMIFWVAVIGMWHVDMFPKIFNSDQFQTIGLGNSPVPKRSDVKSLVAEGALRPDIENTGLTDRAKYSRKSLVVADFSPLEDGYGVNRLYTSMILSLGVMSFIIITYGLHSGFSLIT